MMRKILNIFLVAAASMLLSCNKENITYPAGGSTGTLDLTSIALTCNTEETVLRSGRNINTQDFIVSIYNVQNVLQNEWTYKEMPEVLTLSAGEYVLKVKSHEPHDAAWDAPYYYAEKNFAIVADQMTVIGDIVCVLSNVKVTVEYSDDLLAVLGEGCKVNVGLGLGTLDFSIDESRAGYFTVKEESNRLYAYFMGPIDGYIDTIYREIDNVKAGEWRILRYSLKSPEPGDSANGNFTTSLRVDVSCYIVEQNVEIPVEEDIIEDPEPSNPDTPTPPPSGEEDPVITATTFDINEPQIVTPDLTIKIMVTSENPLLGFIHESNLSSRPSWFFAEPSYLGFYLGLNITFINDYIKQNGYNKNKRIIFMFIYFISCISIGSNTLYVALTLSFIISFFEKIKYISYNIYTNIIIIIIAIILIVLPTLDFFSLYLEFEAVQNSSMGDRQSRIISSSVIMQDMNLKDYIIGMGSSTVEILTGKGESNVYYKLFVEQGIVSIILYIYFIKNQFKHCPLYVFTYIILAFNATIVHFMPLTFFNIFALSSFYNNKIQKNRYD